MSKLDKVEKPLKTIYFVRKDTMKEYSLMKIVIKGNLVISEEVLHRDIPLIVYGKYSQKLKAQGFNNAD